MTEVSVDFEIKWKEYYHIIAEQMRKRTAVILVIVGVFIAFTSAMAVLFAPDPEKEFLGSLIAAALILTALMVLFVIPRYIIDRTNFPYERTFIGQHHAIVSEDGVSASFEFCGNLVAWNQLCKIKEKRYNFYFFTTGKQWTFLPKIDMTTEDVVNLRKLIHKCADTNTVIRIHK